MKKSIRNLAAALAAVLALSCFSLFCGCDGETGGKSEYEIWGTYNSVKVQQDLAAENYADVKLPAEINIETAKNEYESGQLIITAKTDVSSFNVEISDLQGTGGAVIKKENIQLHKQRYVHVKSNMTTIRPFLPGWYPDALVPLDKAYEKGENTVKAGGNQGLYITVYTGPDVASGLYTGRLTVTVDGDENIIPVTVSVWDFTVPEEVHTQSAFYLRRDWIINGELDNTMDMYTKYYEFLLDYRISATNLPYENLYDGEGFVELAKKYAADPRCSAYNLPYRVVVHTVDLENPKNPEQKTKMITDIDYELLEDIVVALARESTPELNLLDKAYMYFVAATDEPQMSGTEDNVRHITVQYHRLFEKIIADLKAEDPKFFEKRGLTEDDIMKLPNLVTTSKVETVDGFVSTYVPQFQHFDTEAERQGYYDSIQNDEYSSGEVWWYGCFQPAAPYPTYHVDDYMLSSRTLSWMQYEYGISGNLYWGTNTYVYPYGHHIKPANVWEDATRWTGGVSNGDGFLLYPGVDYGVYGPLPSMRLESIRDGLEDYEYLWLFEQEIEKANKKYGTSFSSEEILEKLFRKLYTGVISTTDSSVFVEVRRELAQMIEMISVDANIFTHIDNIDVETGNATVSVYYDSDYTLTVNGKEVEKTTSGDGSKSVVQVSLSDAQNYLNAVVSNGTESYEIGVFVSNRVSVINGFGAQEIESVKIEQGLPSRPVEHMTVSALEFGGRSVADVKIGKADMGNEEWNALYKPTIAFEKQQLFANVDWRDIDVVSLDVYNNTDAEIKVYLSIRSGTSTRDIVTATLKPHEWTTIKVEQLYNTSWSKLDEAEAILLRFDNDAAADREVYLDTLYFSTNA